MSSQGILVQMSKSSWNGDAVEDSSDEDYNPQDGKQGYQLLTEVKNGASMSSLFSILSLFTGGFICLLYGGPIDWRSWKQRIVSLSTTEAEYISMIEATKSLYWWKRIFRDIDFNPEEDLEIYCDNSSTVNLLSKETTMIHTKL
jgi:hypothetical protein